MFTGQPTCYPSNGHVLVLWGHGHDDVVPVERLLLLQQMLLLLLLVCQCHLMMVAVTFALSPVLQHPLPRRAAAAVPEV